MTSKKETFQVTCWLRPHDTVEVIIDCLAMKIPNRNWLQMEVERWAAGGKYRDPKNAYVRENSEGMVAMFTDAAGMIEISPEGQE